MASKKITRYPMSSRTELPNMDGAEVDLHRAHEWFVPEFIGYECCRKCGIVRRRDDENKPCRGVARVTLRDR